MQPKQSMEFDSQKAPPGLKVPPEVKAIPADIRKMMSAMPEADLDKDEAYGHPAIKALSKKLQKKEPEDLAAFAKQINDLKKDVFGKFMAANTDEELDQYRFPMRQLNHVWRAVNAAMHNLPSNAKKATVGMIYHATTAPHLQFSTQESSMSDAVLRKRLIRLAHEHPEFRQDLIPLLKEACCTEGPAQGKFEEGKPADPTEHMSEEDAKKWQLSHLQNKDNFKAASQAIVRRTMTIQVRVTQQREDSTPLAEEGDILIGGMMSISFGDSPTTDLNFLAGVRPMAFYTVTRFYLRKSLSGSGAEFVEVLLKNALEEVLKQHGDNLIREVPRFS